MKIINGSVFTPEFRFEEKSVLIRNGRFMRMDPDLPDPEDSVEAEAVVDASGCFVIPGLVDIHFHGCMGADFCDGTREAIASIARYEASQGVTAICPATLTLPVETLKDVLRCAADYADERHGPDEADLVGINMEGPFISRVRKGAQNGAYIIPCDISVCESFLEVSRGLVKIAGLAPEENPGFRSYIAAMKDQVRISLAHTDADYETSMAAFEAGACHAVHLFNAMPPMSHRAPGVVGAVRDSKTVMAELICDGNHIHPAVVRAAFDMLGEERIVLISDSLRACGMGDGRMMLGGQEVEVHGTRATLAGSGALAGSVCSLTRCLQIAVKRMNIPLEYAVRCATYNPARAIGIQDAYGSIEAGRKADCVLLNRQDLSVQAVVKDGRLLR
jgi:N-acetylglucosamine-6-phosphate deacetylase